MLNRLSPPPRLAPPNSSSYSRKGSLGMMVFVLGWSTFDSPAQCSAEWPGRVTGFRVFLRVRGATSMRTCGPCGPSVGRGDRAPSWQFHLERFVQLGPSPGSWVDLPTVRGLVRSCESIRKSQAPSTLIWCKRKVRDLPSFH